MLYLGELEEVLELTQAEEFAKVQEPLFRQISRCLTSSHFQARVRRQRAWVGQGRARTGAWCTMCLAGARMHLAPPLRSTTPVADGRCRAHVL